MDRAGVRNVARQMRYFDAHLQHALDLVLTGVLCVLELESPGPKANDQAVRIQNG